MSKKFDPTKPVQTRDGRPARIICTDRKHEDKPIVVLVKTGYDEEVINVRTADGKFCEGVECDGDLVNVTTKREGWINIYPGVVRPVCDEIWPTREEAEKENDGRENWDRVACVRIEWEE